MASPESSSGQPGLAGNLLGDRKDAREHLVVTADQAAPVLEGAAVIAVTHPCKIGEHTARSAKHGLRCTGVPEASLAWIARPI